FSDVSDSRTRRFTEGEGTQRSQRGKSRNKLGISPAKTQRPQRQLLSELGALRALAGGISESEVFCVVIRFAPGAQILKRSCSLRLNVFFLRSLGFGCGSVE